MPQAQRCMAHGCRQKLGLGTHQQLLQVVPCHRTRSQPQRPNQVPEEPPPRSEARQRVSASLPSSPRPLRFELCDLCDKPFLCSPPAISLPLSLLRYFSTTILPLCSGSSVSLKGKRNSTMSRCAH